MKRKELKNLAKKIAENEFILNNSNDIDERDLARDAIMELTGKVHDFSDLDILDEMVQDILNSMS